MKKLILYFLTVFLLFLGLNPLECRADVTLSQLIQGIRDRSLALDVERHPDSLLKRFLNEEQEDIATTASAIQKDTVIIMTADGYGYPLPSNYYLVYAVWLNANPDDANTRISALKYVPAKDFNMEPRFQTGRPGQWSIWNDSIHIDQPSSTETDTLFVKYFAHATDMSEGSALMTLPENFKKYLIDRVVIKCYDRVQLTGPARENILADIARQEAKLLERPTDER